MSIIHPCKCFSSYTYWFHVTILLGPNIITPAKLKARETSTEYKHDSWKTLDSKRTKITNLLFPRHQLSSRLDAVTKTESNLTFGNSKPTLRTTISSSYPHINSALTQETLDPSRNKRTNVIFTSRITCHIAESVTAPRFENHLSHSKLSHCFT